MRKDLSDDDYERLARGKPLQPRCDRCEWWRKIRDDAGDCVTRSPVPIVERVKGAPLLDEVWGVWPMTAADDWCGQYRLKDEDQ